MAGRARRECADCGHAAAWHSRSPDEPCQKSWFKSVPRDVAPTGILSIRCQCRGYREATG